MGGSSASLLGNGIVPTGFSSCAICGGSLKSRLAGGSSVFATSLAAFDLEAMGGRFFTTLTGSAFLAGTGSSVISLLAGFS
ncbi:hypothetical protein D3C86_1978660 [compost metagenome]